MLRYLKKLLRGPNRERDIEAKLRELQQKAPIPLFWLLGKTQTGKTSIVRFLTGAEEAEIGHGFRPTTQFSREYYFPTESAPLLRFLDTRGLGEADYDPKKDLEQSSGDAHVLVVTVRVLDHAQHQLIEALQKIRKSDHHRPVVLVLTCLHEAYPQQQHPSPYAFGPDEADGDTLPDELSRSIAEHERRFEGLVDRVVPIDLTKPEEGFSDPNYGGEHFKNTLIELLPDVYGQTLLRLDAATRELRDWHEQQSMPYIISYCSLAATAGAIPIPFVDLVLLPAIQSRMIYQLAQLYGQPLSGRRFLELAGSVGIGMVVQQSFRSLTKFIPGVGSVVSGALAASSTFALGKSFCYYYSDVLNGHVPRPEELKRYYQQQLEKAEHLWKKAEEPKA